MLCFYVMDYEILFVVPMWPWLLTWALFCCLKKDFWPQSHDTTSRIIFRIKIKVHMCTPVFETSPHNWLKLFATKDLNSRLNITDESYNPRNDTGLVPYSITRHVPSVNFWTAKHGNPVMTWSRVHHNKRKVAQWLTANSPLSMDPEIPFSCSRYSGCIYLFLCSCSSYEHRNDTPRWPTKKLTLRWIIAAIILRIAICMARG